MNSHDDDETFDATNKNVRAGENVVKLKSLRKPYTPKRTHVHNIFRISKNVTFFFITKISQNLNALAFLQLP